MTRFATHRFSVGQPVSCAGKSTGSCKVEAQTSGQSGAEYSITCSDGRTHKGVPEREVTYRPPSAS